MESEILLSLFFLGKLLPVRQLICMFREMFDPNTKNYCKISTIVKTVEPKNVLNF